MKSARVGNKKNRASASYRRLGALHGIEEYELIKNGLRVLYTHDSSAPVVGVMVTYLVGSKHEVPGRTGATHILEHLMFKGSKHFPPKKGKDVLTTLSKKGALINASTWLDRTNYYEVFPKEHFDFVINLEADRMRNARITEKDLAEELPAIKSEYAMSSGSDAVCILDEHMWATAFMAHPYHHPTIGWFSDIEHVTVNKLKEFYDTYYHPHNAVVTIVGDISREYALERVCEAFGVHKRPKTPLPQIHTKEPPQQGRRFVEVKRHGTKNLVSIAYKVPEALHKDTPTLLTLASILGEGKTSRLYRGLVEKEIASEAWTMYMPFYDPSLMMFFATPTNGHTHEAVQQAMVTEAKKVVLEGVTKAEHNRVSAGLLTDIKLSRDGHYGLLSTLNEAIAIGDWRTYFRLPKRIQQLTPSRIQETAKKYFRDDTMTVGYYHTNEK